MLHCYFTYATNAKYQKKKTKKKRIIHASFCIVLCFIDFVLCGCFFDFPLQLWGEDNKFYFSTFPKFAKSESWMYFVSLFFFLDACDQDGTCSCSPQNQNKKTNKQTNKTTIK